MSQQAQNTGKGDLNFPSVSNTRFLPKVKARSSNGSSRKNIAWKEIPNKAKISSKDRVSGMSHNLIKSKQQFVKSSLDTDSSLGEEKPRHYRPNKSIFLLKSKPKIHIERDTSLYSRLSPKIAAIPEEEFKFTEESSTKTNCFTQKGEGDVKSQIDSCLCNGVESLCISDYSISRNDVKYNRPLSPLQLSLFPNVPPSFYFSLSEPLTKLPARISDTLKWKLSSLTPTLIRDIVQRSGFKIVKDEGFWASTWGRHIHCHQFRLIKENQKVNHFPGTFHIGRKDRLWLNILRMQDMHGKQAFSFMPQTFILPQQMKQLEDAWTESGHRSKWIIKPPASARGMGVSVIHRWSDVPQTEPVIVQRYISYPYLINGTKFDLRLYVLVTSFDPLRLYIFDDGLVRFASVKYSRSIKSLSEKFIHLTNYSINRTNSCYTSNEDENIRQGHKWSLKSLWSYFRENNVDDKKVWSSLVDVVIKTLISCEDPINRLVRIYAKNRYICYELFGFDIMLDNTLKPWLLEVNITPSLHSNSQLDEKIKAQLIKDTLNTVGIHIPHVVHLVTESQLEFLRRIGIHSQKTMFWNKILYQFAVSRDEKYKQSRIEKKGWYQSSILKDLSPDDVRHLVQSEDELVRCGNFIRVFPSKASSVYLHYFETPKYYNLLLDAWENKYSGDKRKEGIALLQALCKQRFHLQTSSPQDILSCLTMKSRSSETQVSFTDDNLHGDDKTKRKSIFASKLFPLHLFSDQPEEI